MPNYILLSLENVTPPIYLYTFNAISMSEVRKLLEVTKAGLILNKTALHINKQIKIQAVTNV